MDPKQIIKKDINLLNFKEDLFIEIMNNELISKLFLS